MTSGIPWDATTVTSHGGGRYTATIGPEWVLAVAPQGGVVAAIAARAMAAELHAADGAGQALRSTHGVFVSPVPAGPVVVDVEVLRRGRSISQARATVRGADAASGYTALAVFGAAREGFAFTEPAYPDVADAEDLRSFRDPLPPEAGVLDRGPMPFWEQVIEGRPALGHDFWDPTPRTSAHAANWYRFDHEPIGADGRLDPYALFVVADIMPNAVFERIGPTDRRWFAPSADLTVHLFGAASPGWILAEYRAHRAGDGYASVEANLWDPRGAHGPELVAYATQQMFFTPFD
jgi:acyl-CoA thioesterase